MEYFAERNQLKFNEFKINFEDLKKYFYQTYKYLHNKNYFECALKGVRISTSSGFEEKQIIPPSLSPSPEIFFIKHLSSSEIYPIYEYYEDYNETILFTVIEILYNHIGYYDYKKSRILSEKPRSEFIEHINSFLKFYDEGYYLEPTQGFIMKIPNEPLKNLMNERLSEICEDDVISKYRTAIRMYYRFDSDYEMKKKAINLLADILEPIRESLKDLLNHQYKINKNKHDKLIFGIVNNFNIRHNNVSQNKDYQKNIWYDWMIQYYSSVIITYYKLQKAISETENL